MRKRIALLVALLAIGVVPIAGATHPVTYFYNQTTSNHWKLSQMYVVRYHHWMRTGLSCLPSYAQLQVANYRQAPDGGLGTQINTHRSPFGACEFNYPLTSNGIPAKAACRIISSGGQVTRLVECQVSGAGG